MINYHVSGPYYSNRYVTPVELTYWLSKIDRNYLSGFWHALVIL